MLHICTINCPKGRTAESRGLRQESGQGCDTLKLPSPSEVLEVSSQGETNDLKRLLNELRGLYEDRMRLLELDRVSAKEDMLQKKVDFLQSYVNDLAEQNQVLVQTVEDLQEEAKDEVSWRLGAKHRTSEGRINESEVELRNLALDEVVPMAHILYNSGCSAHITAAMEDLKIQLGSKDVNADLEKTLAANSQRKKGVLEGSGQLMRLQDEPLCLQRIQKDDMTQTAEKDVCITKLNANVQLLEEEEAEADDVRDQLFKLNERVRELQDELKSKEEQWRQREDDLTLTYEGEHKKAEEQMRRRRRDGEEELVKAAEEWKRRFEDEREAYAQATKKWAEKTSFLNSESRVSEEHVRDLDRDAVALRAARYSLKRSAAVTERRAQQLLHENAQGNLAALQSKLKTTETVVRDLNETVNQVQSSLNEERGRRQQIEDQYLHAHVQVERLQRKLTRVRHSTEKKIQKREVEMCALVKALTESKKRHSDSHDELLSRRKVFDKLCETTDDLRAELEERSRECVHLSQAKDRLDADLVLTREKLQTARLEVQSRDHLILQLRAEIKTADRKHRGTLEEAAALEGEVRRLNQKVRGHQEAVRDIERLNEQKESEKRQLHNQLCIRQQQVESSDGLMKKKEVELDRLRQQLKGVQDQLKEAGLKLQQQEETGELFKQKYTGALEKVHRLQERVETLGEELRYAQEELKASRGDAYSVKKELAELEGRYQDGLGQWEDSRDALEKLTDELQANRNLLMESRQKVDHFTNLMDAVRQQKLMFECDLRLYQQSHSHSDDEYLSLLRRAQQLQKLCAEQTDRLSECEKAILQMKQQMKTQVEEKAALKQSLVSCRRAYMNKRSQLEREVTRLKKDIRQLELRLSDTNEVRVTFLGKADEELKEAERDAATKCKELDDQRGEVQRLQEEIREEKDETGSALRETRISKSRSPELGHNVEELRKKYQLTVEELAARAEEVRQTEGERVVEKTRSVAERLEMSVAEFKKNLQQAADQKINSEREQQVTRDQAGFKTSVMAAAALTNNPAACVGDRMMKGLGERSRAMRQQMKVNSLRSEVERTRRDDAKLRRERRLLAADVERWIAEQNTRAQERPSLSLSRMEDEQTKVRSNPEAVGMQKSTSMCPRWRE